MTDFHPETDLDLTRDMTASPAKVWRAWTEPDLLCRWFCPPPWRCTQAVIDAVPGGRFMTAMEGPEGERMEQEGAFLAVEAERLLTFTDALSAGYRPRTTPFMTATVRLTPQGGGTRYDVHVQHATAEGRAQHEAMGFAEGWGTAAAQLDALAATL